jgi:hypothetical protein
VTLSFPTPSTHVAVQIRYRKPFGYHFCVEARAGGRDPRSLNGPMSQNSIRQILPAPFSHTVVVPKQSDGRPEALSNNPNRVARLGPSLISQGQRLIQNLRGGFKALRSLSFRSRVQACKQARGIKSILVSPLYRKSLSLLAAHDEQQNTEGPEACSKNQTMEFTA